VLATCARTPFLFRAIQIGNGSGWLFETLPLNSNPQIINRHLLPGFFFMNRKRYVKTLAQEDYRAEDQGVQPSLLTQPCFA
jgi:hypothetical protein